MEQADIELLRLYACDGDQGAFARLVERHRGWVFAAARRRLGDDHLAEDATQAVFVVLAEKAGRLVGMKRGAISAWLFHVMHFACGRVRRTEGRRVERERRSGAVGKQESQVDAGLLVLLEDCIAQLPVAMRELIVRRFYRRESLGEIGDAMKISAEAARKRASRALGEIKGLMVRDGVDAIPDVLLESLDARARSGKGAVDSKRIVSKGKVAMAEQQAATGGYNLISVEFLVRSVEENLEFFEKLGFPQRWLDKLDEKGRLPRASLTAGTMGKVWVRRAGEEEVLPSSSINPFFWVDGGPEALVAYRKKIAEQGIVVSAIIDEYALPNFAVTTPDGYAVRFFTQYV